MKVGELCAGYGGIGLGLRLAGEDIHISWIAEVDDTLATAIWDGTDIDNLGDITKVDWTQVEPVDLLTAGFPCQPFSAAGNQLAEADPRYLWPAVRDAIAALLPPRVLLENVRNLVSMRKGVIWARILDDLTSLGYDVTWLTLGACAVGAAHHRHRVFALATHTQWSEPRVTRLDVQECGAKGDLLPTVTSRDGSSGSGHAISAEGSPDLRTTVTLLPTPAARDGASRGVLSQGQRKSPNLGTELATNFDRFQAAVGRHAAIFGPPPAPTEPNRNGAPRLSAAFAEWLMCISAGHVTDALSRKDALKAIGNGVCPPQLAAAWRLLTNPLSVDKPNDTSIGFGAMTTSTSADVKEIQDRNAAARGRVIDATMALGVTVDPALIQAAMMELAAVWREEAAHITAAKRKGHVSIAKEYTQAAARLAGFAVGLTTRPITNAERVSAMAETWDNALAATCEHPRENRSILANGQTMCTLCQARFDQTGPEFVAEGLADALPEGDPVAAVFSSPFQRVAGPGETVPAELTGSGPMFPGQIGYRAGEHGRPQAPCYECAEVGEDPAPWCDCRPEDGAPCKGPCRLEAHTYTFHPGGCTHYARHTNPDLTTCPYCHETLPLTGDEPLGTKVVVGGIEFTKIGNDPFSSPAQGRDLHEAGHELTPGTPHGLAPAQSEEQNLRDIIGPLGASSVTATIDHPFTNPGVPWLNRRPTVEVVPFHELPIIAAALPEREFVSHSFVETYEGCGVKTLLGRASRHGLIGAQRPMWGILGGKAFHAAVEQIERLALSGVAIADDVETLWTTHFEATIKEQLDALVGTPYADSSTWYISNRGKEGFDWWRVEGAKMLGLYVKHHTAEWRAANATFLLQDKTPVIELPYTMSIRSLDGERGLTARGFVDRATLDMSTYSLTVLDYKTGARDPESTFQLGEYGHALLMAMGIPGEPPDRPILGRYWLARKGIYTDAVPVVTRHPLTELQYRYDNADRGTKARVFTPHVTNLCKSCSVTDYCPAQAGRS